ncbi:hypothetical protein M0811_13607 [Anaeramoeba ignava]|uniref:Uncharacterized protein n=1 Tax=Anaeramoeba ignava TaxID=1746090 RepID=A0A9Q0R4S2_ANAIG|nr:hypothetical protein M0811_13607 [Anaeramoeba ignava]
MKRDKSNVQFKEILNLYYTIALLSNETLSNLLNVNIYPNTEETPITFFSYQEIFPLKTLDRLDNGTLMNVDSQVGGLYYTYIYTCN